MNIYYYMYPGIHTSGVTLLVMLIKDLSDEPYPISKSVSCHSITLPNFIPNLIFDFTSITI